MAYNKVELDGSTIIDLSTDTAVANDVLSGKTFHTNIGEKVTGSIVKVSGATITPTTTTQTAIAANRYANGAITVKGDANLVSSNIRSGATIFGVPGSMYVVNTQDANAAADEILGTKTAYVNGSKVTGSLVDNRNRVVQVTSGTSGASVTKLANSLKILPTNVITVGNTYGMEINDDVIAVKGGLAANPSQTTNDQILQGNTYYGVSGSMPKHLGDVDASAVYSDTQSASGKIYLEVPEAGYYTNPNALQASISDVRNAYNSENGNVIAAGNIKSGVNIMGVTGTYSPAEVNLQNKTLAASALNLSSGTQTVNPDSGYDGMTSLVITKPTTLVSGNIKSGVSIAGVTGTYTGLVPSGTITLTNLNATDVTNYASAKVDSTNISSSNIKKGITILGVSGSSTVVDTALSSGAVTANKMASGYSAFVNGTQINGSLTAQAAKTVTPTTATQTVVSSGKYTTGDVKVAAIQTETKTVTSNGTVTPTSGKYLTSVTVNIPEWDGTVV